MIDVGLSDRSVKQSAKRRVDTVPCKLTRGAHRGWDHMELMPVGFFLLQLPPWAGVPQCDRRRVIDERLEIAL